jgi:hypothetical protein
MNWQAHHAKRVTEMNREAEEREELMKIVRSPVVRPELKQRAKKELMNLEFKLAMKEIVA